MSGRFLITGLPRSRTAWFALVAGATHEPISQMGYSVFKPQWTDGRGVSDSGASLYLAEILAEFAPRTLIVERDIGEVLTSFLRYAAPLRIDAAAVARQLWSMRRYLAKIDHPLVRRVGFHELNDYETMRSCMDWLGIDPPNLHEAMRFNVQSDLSWNLRLLKEGAA